MKRVLCLLLCLLMLTAVLAGCGKEYAENVIIPVYLSSELTTFDPAVAYSNEGAVQILSLLYKGLFSYDEKGKAVFELADRCETESNDEDGIYTMTVHIKETCWSDNISVKAEDFVYAFKRILEPDFYCEAASLLYELKNAKLIKSGDASIDDLGAVSIDAKTIQFTFEEKPDFEQFKEILCSPALYPLREDYVTRDPNWASCSSTLVANGPFVLKGYEAGKSMLLERNIYYCRKATGDKVDPITKAVLPYRIMINLRLNAKKNLEAFGNGKQAYNSGISLDSRSEYAASANISDQMSTLAYFFNTEKEPFNNPDVRKALSMAIDRNEIVSRITFAKPAEGLISYGVYDTVSGTSFRGASESLISAEADINGAKALLKSAKVSGGEFTLTVRGDNEVETAVADYVAGVWKKLGFNVTVNKLRPKELSDEESVYDNMYIDNFIEAYTTGDFDVISIDYQMLTKYAFNALAPFAKEYAGNAMDMTTGEYIVEPNITRYDSEEYNAIINEAFAEKDAAKRAEILHRAEAKLLADMPVTPLVHFCRAYISKADLKGVLDKAFSVSDFTRAELENYESYQEES